MQVPQTKLPTTRVVLLGYGAINRRVASLLRARHSASTLVGVIVRRPDSLPGDLLDSTQEILDREQLVALAPDIVVEAASNTAVREWGAAALSCASRLVISSASALIDDDLLQLLRTTARQSGSQLVLSPGALAGIEALSAGARLSMREVRHKIIKPPASWGGSSESKELSTSAVRTVLFEGTARESARRYPLNANVSVVCALATLGLDRTRVELVSDPSVNTNCHEIYAVGEFGTLVLKIENRPSPGNPKSSELAALALVRLVENEVADLVM